MAIAATAAIVTGVGLSLLTGCDQGSSMEGPIQPAPECPHLLAQGFAIQEEGVADASGSAGGADTTLVWEWDEILHGQLAVPAGDTDSSLHITFFDIDSVGFDPAGHCTTEYTLVADIVDTSIAQIAVIPGGFWNFELRGKRDGTTSVRFRPRHEAHSHYQSRAVLIVVGTGVSETPVVASGVVIRSGGSIVASWNYPPGLGESFGTLIAEDGHVTGPLAVSFLDSTGTEFVPGGGATLALEVEHPVVATITPEPGDPWAFNLEGHPYMDLLYTSLRVKIMDGGTTVFVSGPISVVRDDSGRLTSGVKYFIARVGTPETPDLLIWEGELADSACSLAGVSDTLTAVVGVEGDSLRVRGIREDPPGVCTGYDLFEEQYHLAFEFADPAMVTVVRDPASWGATFRLRGELAGTTTVRIWLVHIAGPKAHLIAEFPPITVVVE